MAAILTRHVRELSVTAALLLVLGALALFAPAFYQPQPLLSLLAREAPALLVSAGMALVMIGRQIDISVGSQFAICSVGAGMLSATGWPIGLAALASIFIGANASISASAQSGLFTPRRAIFSLPSMAICPFGVHS